MWWSLFLFNYLGFTFDLPHSRIKHVRRWRLLVKQRCLLTRRARAATVALETGKAGLWTLSAVTSAARALPPGSTACKLTQDIYHSLHLHSFSPPPLSRPYRLSKSCPLTRCVFKNNQMNKMQRPWGIMLRDPISWRLVTWLNFPKQPAKVRKLNWFLFAHFTTLCSALPLLFCDIIIHHSLIALCQHYSSTHHV